MSAEFAWLTEHSHKIHEKYAGKWIAVLDGHVIGVGKTATEAANQADAKCSGADYVLEAVDLETERIG